MSDKPRPLAPGWLRPLASRDVYVGGIHLFCEVSALTLLQRPDAEGIIEEVRAEFHKMIDEWPRTESGMFRVPDEKVTNGNGKQPI